MSVAVDVSGFFEVVATRLLKSGGNAPAQTHCVASYVCADDWRFRNDGRADHESVLVVDGSYLFYKQRHGDRVTDTINSRAMSSK